MISKRITVRIIVKVSSRGRESVRVEHRAKVRVRQRVSVRVRVIDMVRLGQG